MKAAVAEEPGRLVVREVPEPVMGEYDCLCAGLYGATCSGTDLHLLNGHPLFGVEFPTILGHESIGRVLGCGPKVRSFRVGDVVTRLVNRATPDLRVHWGGYAERGLVQDWRAMQEDGVPPEFTPGTHWALPSDFEPAASTMVITWRETFSFLTRIGVEPGDKVLVMGTGGNGLAYANHAANLLAETVCVVGSPQREADARRVGATHFVSYREEDLVATARAQGLGDFDLVIDAVGKVGQLDRCLPLLRARGTAAIYGIDDYGNVTLTPTKVAGGFTFANYGYAEGDTHASIVKLIQRGLLDARNFCDLDRIFPLEEINAAFAAVKAREVIKAVVRLSDEA
jgi:D-arabinose 1-dehydrogenase-like Zn-dependent alcohol dehydrogenase